MPTYTYDDSHPTDKDKIRSLIPDTDVSDASRRLLSNEQINLFLAQNSNDLNLALADALEAIASDLSKDSGSYNYGATGANVSITQPAAYFLRRAKQIRDRIAEGDVYFSEEHVDFKTDGIGNDISKYTGD